MKQQTDISRLVSRLKARIGITLKSALVIGCLSSFGNIPAYGEGHSKALKILLKDGTSTSYILDNKTKIVFENSNMLFSNNNWKFEIPVENLSNWTYVMSQSSSLSSIEREVTIRQTGDILRISGIRPDAEILVFTVDGKLIRHLKSDSVDIDIVTADWIAGIYLIKIGESTYKIIKS